MKKSVNVEKMFSLKTLDEKIAFCQDNQAELKALNNFFNAVKAELKENVPDIKGYEQDTFNYKIKVSFVAKHIVNDCYKKTITFK